VVGPVGVEPTAFPRNRSSPLLRVSSSLQKLFIPCGPQTRLRVFWSPSSYLARLRLIAGGYNSSCPNLSGPISKFLWWFKNLFALSNFNFVILMASLVVSALKILYKICHYPATINLSANLYMLFSL